VWPLAGARRAIRSAAGRAARSDPLRARGEGAVRGETENGQRREEQLGRERQRSRADEGPGIRARLDIAHIRRRSVLGHSEYDARKRKHRSRVRARLGSRAGGRSFGPRFTAAPGPPRTARRCQLAVKTRRVRPAAPRGVSALRGSLPFSAVTGPGQAFGATALFTIPPAEVHTPRTRSARSQSVLKRPALRQPQQRCGAGA